LRDFFIAGGIIKIYGAKTKLRKAPEFSVFCGIRGG
jgi:hypothetical protein